MDEPKILALLKDTRGWEIQGKALARKFSFSAFAEAIAFVNRIAELAERIDHHPDMSINYRSVTLFSWSHDSNGITMRDFKLARAINSISCDHTY